MPELPLGAARALVEGTGSSVRIVVGQLEVEVRPRSIFVRGSRGHEVCRGTRKNYFYFFHDVDLGPSGPRGAAEVPLGSAGARAWAVNTPAGAFISVSLPGTYLIEHVLVGPGFGVAVVPKGRELQISSSGPVVAAYVP
ncbi:MAG: hypothetical protein ABWK00_00290 [Desulfurococcaceae archaeon]